MVDEALLYWMKCFTVCDTLDRRDIRSVRLHRQSDTRCGDLAVNEHSTRTTYTDTARFFRTSHV